MAVSVLKTICDGHVGDETHPYPYPDELTVWVHDSVFCIVVCGPGGPRETIVWRVMSVVGTPGVVISKASFLAEEMWMRKEVMEGVGRAYLNSWMLKPEGLICGIIVMI